MKALQNKVAIITGASSGIGRATAKLFTQEGAKVVAAARRQNELNQLVKEIAQEGGEARAFVGDVSNEVFSKSLVEFTLKEFGKLDIAFNNAGTLGVLGTTTDLSLGD